MIFAGARAIWSYRAIDCWKSDFWSSTKLHQDQPGTYPTKKWTHGDTFSVERVYIYIIYVYTYIYIISHHSSQKIAGDMMHRWFLLVLSLATPGIARCIASHLAVLGQRCQHFHDLQETLWFLSSNMGVFRQPIWVWRSEIVFNNSRMFGVETQSWWTWF